MTLYQKQMQFSLLLQNVYPKEEAESITSYVFQELLKVSALELKTRKNELLNHDLAEKLDGILSRLYKKEPVQYVLGVAYFYDLKFVVNEEVLIPRRETEELVHLILQQNKLPQPRILDIGTGSGCIAVSLKKNISTAEVFAIDKSANAIRMAKLNAANNLGVDKERKFLPRDIFDKSWWDALGKFDIIVSNPPYITENEKSLMHDNVLSFEPHDALFVSNNAPLVYYDAIANFASQNLNPNGILYFEINEAFGAQTKELLQSKGFTHVEVYKDMQGKDRMVAATIA